MKTHLLKGIILINLLFLSPLLAQFSLEVQATSVVPRKFAAYDFVFQSLQNIPPSAEFLIVFSKDFLLAKIVMADSRSMTGGFTIAVQSDTIIAKRTGLGNTLAAREQADLKVAMIANPTDMEKEHDFHFIIRDNGRVLLDEIVAAKITEISRN